MGEPSVPSSFTSVTRRHYCFSVKTPVKIIHLQFALHPASHLASHHLNILSLNHFTLLLVFYRWGVTGRQTDRQTGSQEVRQLHTWWMTSSDLIFFFYSDCFMICETFWGSLSNIITKHCEYITRPIHLYTD